MSEMDLGITKKLEPLLEEVRTMIRDEILPLDEEYLDEVNKGDRWTFTGAANRNPGGALKVKAREKGLWNFWLTASDRGFGLSTVEYAYHGGRNGARHISVPRSSTVRRPIPATWKCWSAYCTDAQKERWLTPLLAGEIRSAYLMTEPDVASSDATNVSMRCERDGDEYVLNGEKWWSSGRRRSAMQNLHRHGEDRQ